VLWVEVDAGAWELKMNCANIGPRQPEDLMKHTIEIDCPPEILMGLHLDAKRFAELVKLQSAVALFKEGKLSSGMAARWLGMPRVHFLMHAMQAGGASLLEDNEDDLARETALL
jgi:predicted HTH domain antitoxin